MPWSTPTLRDVRSMVRDNVRGSLPGADATVPNSVLRVLSDNQGALCHLTLQYLDWLALQLLPDTAETEWLDRHGDIWLVNADGSTGRKVATNATGVAEFLGTAAGVTVPVGTLVTAYGGRGDYETIVEFVAHDVPSPGPIRAIDPGKAGNLLQGATLAVGNALVAGLSSQATVVTLEGGTDEETDDQLRVRVLHRIQQPPQGGAAHDYVQWALAVPGVTRAWCTPNEMGIGTVTVRFMMDDLRSENDGFPLGTDCAAVAAYIDTVRPVAVKDFWVVAPIKQRVDVAIDHLMPDTESIRAAIQQSLKAMLFHYAAPGQTIYAAWKSSAIIQTAGVVSFYLRNNVDDVMESPGHMAVLGDIAYGR